MSPEDLSAESLPAHIGTAFVVVPGDEVPELSLELHDVTAWGPPPAAPGQRQPFTITLRGPADPLLPQATYAMTHPAFGALDIFIVPIGRDADGVRYEAVFS